MIDKEELEKLSPEERIKKLREIEEKNRKELKEIEELIKKTREELTQRVTETVEVPESEPVDISHIFGEEERGELETTTEVPQQLEPEIKYQIEQDYETLKSFLYSGVNEEMMAKIDEIGERLDKTRYMRIPEEMAQKAIAARYLFHKLKGDLDKV